MRRHVLRFSFLLLLLSGGAFLAGCEGFGLDPSVRPEAVKTLRDSIQKEFDLLAQEFDAVDGKGDVELCAPIRFAVARFALYQTIEEKKAADMAQLTRFITRARRALTSAQARFQARECVDSDGDGLTDLEEVRRYKTKRRSADTDGDGISDGLEARRYGTDPLRFDTDKDLLNDGEEIFFLRLNPLRLDSDHDGYTDGLEVAYGSDPRDACSQPASGRRLPGPWRKCARPKVTKKNEPRSPAPPELAPAVERGGIQILNGNGTSGSAALWGRRLRARDLPVRRIGDASRMDYPRTIIYYRKGAKKMALDVRRVLGRRAALRSLRGTGPYAIVVILGRDLLPQGESDRDGAESPAEERKR